MANRGVKKRLAVCFGARVLLPLKTDDVAKRQSILVQAKKNVDAVSTIVFAFPTSFRRYVDPRNRG